MSFWSSDRVRYTAEHLRKLTETAHEKNSIVALEDRLALLSDNTALAKASLTETSNVLELIKNFSWDETCMKEL